MKRTERHHLKENELEHLARLTHEFYATHTRDFTRALAAVIVIGGIGLGYYLYHSRVQGRASEMLGQAIVVDESTVGPAPATTTSASSKPAFPTEQARSEAALVKYKAAADAYPTTDSGIFARYQEGTTLMALGRPAEAITRYQDVIDKAGTSLYGQMARLGLAEAQARAGQYDQAINTFKELAQRKDGPLPVDGILMQLGRAYLDAGKRSDAEQTFNRVVEEFPASPFATDARRELDTLKKS